MTDTELALAIAEIVCYAADEDVTARERGINMLFGLRMSLRAFGPINHKWHREIGAWEELLADKSVPDREVQNRGYAIVDKLRKNGYIIRETMYPGGRIIVDENETKLEGYNV